MEEVQAKGSDQWSAISGLRSSPGLVTSVNQASFVRS